MNDLIGYGKKSYGVLLLYATSIMALPAQTLTTLHSFDFTDGTQPLSGLVQSASGNLYGTTYLGGLAGTGTVFEITPGGVFSTVGNLAGTVAVLPTGMILATNGNLYGTTVSGNGAVFEISSSGLAILHTFDGADGSFPGELVQAADGNIYGVTGRGGANGDGTVFTITLSGALTTLYNFNGTDGAGALGLLQAVNGKFYGITTAGAANNDGTVFEITAGGAFTTLHSFDATDGSSPAGLIEAANRNSRRRSSFGKEAGRLDALETIRSRGPRRMTPTTSRATCSRSRSSASCENISTSEGRFIRSRNLATESAARIFPL